MPRESYEQLLEQRNALREELQKIRKRCGSMLKQTARVPTKQDRPRRGTITEDIERIGILTEWPKDWVEVIDEIVEDRGEESRTGLLRRWVASGIHRLRPGVKLSDPPYWGGR